jgi:UrcA family protein
VAGQDRPVVVYAEPQEDRLTERVPYGDLNLAVKKDTRRLHRRVASAVQRICLYDGDRIGVLANGYRVCSDEAWDGALPQMAQAIARAEEIALTGKSSIAATAITIKVAAK